MSRVYKYALELTDVQHVKLPRGATVLHVDEQHGQLQLWALVEPHNEPENRLIHIAGTGHILPLPNHVRHINTFVLESGALVFHVFEVIL